MTETGVTLETRAATLIVYADGVTKLADNAKNDGEGWLRGLAIALRETAAELAEIARLKSRPTNEDVEALAQWLVDEAGETGDEEADVKLRESAYDRLRILEPLLNPPVDDPQQSWQHPLMQAASGHDREDLRIVHVR